ILASAGRCQQPRDAEGASREDGGRVGCTLTPERITIRPFLFVLASAHSALLAATRQFVAVTALRRRTAEEAEDAMHVRLDFPSSKYSHDPADRPERIAGLLRKAGHTVELTEDRHPNPMPGGVHLDMDAVLLAAGSYDGALLKVLADSG